MGNLRNKGRIKRWASHQRQKLTDEYTGGNVYSDEIEYDYKGLLTRKGQANPKPIAELPLEIPIEYTPPYIRKEGPDLNVSPFDVYWDSDSDLWDESDFEY